MISSDRFGQFLSLRSGDTVTNEGLSEVLLLLVENFTQYPAWTT